MRATSYFDCGHLYCFEGAGLTGGNCVNVRSVIVYKKVSYILETSVYSIMAAYRNLTPERQASARIRARIRYRETKEFRAKTIYMRVVLTIRSPRKETLIRYGPHEVDDGWMDEDGTFVPRVEKTLD